MGRWLPGSIKRHPKPDESGGHQEHTMRCFSNTASET
jgi:hypothetical protein